MLRVPHAFLMVFAACAAAAVAQSPRLLLDINSTPAPAASSDPGAFGFVRSAAYFRAGTHALGRELYRTDGSAARTSLVRDLWPGAVSSSPTGFVALGSDVLFLARLNERLYVWRTDGTSAGTAPIAEAGGLRSGTTVATATLSSVALFLVEVLPFMYALVRCDGTAAGTAVLGSYEAYGFHSTVTLGGFWFFSTGEHLVRTDGTAAGTISVFTNLSPHAMATLGNQVYFVAASGLWRTAGTPVGTSLVYPTTDLNGGVHTVNGRLVLPARNVLLESDGTSAGTRPLRSFASLAGGNLATIAAGVLFFLGDDGASGNELWSTDGTPVGTRLVADLTPGSAGSTISMLTTFGSRVLFRLQSASLGDELCVTDGTAAGTTCFDLNPGPAGSEPLAIVADANGARALFSAVSATGREPWITDGTAAGTVLLSDIATSPPRTMSSYPARFVSLGRTTFFCADDGVHGLEPWITDGTATGTRLLLDISPGPSPSLAPFHGEPVVVGGNVFFSADTPATGAELWITDGTTTGTRMVADLEPGTASSHPLSLTRLDERRVLFIASGSQGERMWVSDGTAAGTNPIHSAGPGSSLVYGFTKFGAHVVFAAYDAQRGTDLLITDGTIGSTHLLVTLPGLILPESEAVAHAGALYFLVNSGPQSGLWRSNGTAASTGLAVPLSVSPPSWNMGRLRSVRGRLYFLRDEAVHGAEPWVSDGSVVGTHLLKDVAPGAAHSYPEDFIAIDSGVLFETVEHGAWRTDGTPASTQPVANWGYSFLSYVAGSRSAWVVAPPSVWQTDGTAAATRVLPGLTASDAQFGLIGSTLFAGLDDGVHGAELWVVDDAARAVRVGQGCGAPFRAPWLEANDPVLGGRITFFGSDILMGSPAVVLLGAPARPPWLLPMGTCALYLDPSAPLFVLPAATFATRFDAFLSVPSHRALDGTRLMAQAVSVGGGTGLGLDLTNGVALTLSAR